MKRNNKIGNKVLAILFTVALILPLCSIQGIKAEAAAHSSANGITTIDNGQMRSNMSAFDILHQMGVGINLGNTMESCGTWINSSSVSNFETAWGAPITTQNMVTGMKNAGFKSIRIPVAWSNMMSTDGSYTINTNYFNRVETIMNYAFNEGMYVIINIHFDSGWWAQFGSKNANERSQAMVKYRTMWTQIANRYKEYSDYLIFESANEELGTRLNSTDDYAGSGYFTNTQQLYNLTNQINQAFVDVVRGTGGNNSRRHLLIAGYDTDISKTCQSGFQMPTDTIQNHMMVSVHYYSPPTYCLVEDTNNSWGYKSSWGTSADIAEMKSALSNMKIYFANKGIPVIIGEYAVCDTKLSNGSYQRKQGRDVFIQTLCEYALTNGMCPMLWDTGGLFNRSQCTITNSTDAAVFSQMATLAQNTSVFVPPTANGTLTWNGTIGNTGWCPVTPVAGNNCDFVLTGLGGCYAISGVNWSAYTNPALTLTSTASSGTVSYKLSTVVNADNQYWIYIEDNQAQKTGSWTLSSSKEIDLSGLGLTGQQTVYICFVTDSFNCTANLKIGEKN